jgi:Polyketide cyclase / dehydrase and lipid transport
MADRAELILDVEVDAPPEAVWAAVVDWDAQGDWMLGTKVRGTVQDGVGVGGGIEAFTGVGRVGFLDTMVITSWDPPHRCDVEHTGRLIRGSGVFEVLSLPGGTRSRFVWTERVDLPLGWAGRLGWPLVRPLVAGGVRLSLKRLARQVAAAQS